MTENRPDSQLHIRISSKDSKSLREAAKKNGMSVSDWIRSTSVKTAERQLEKDKEADEKAD
jgi:uncharacterized protein (DUF1778 family)